MYVNYSTDLRLLLRHPVHALNPLLTAIPIPRFIQEAETLRTRYNEGVLENQRLDQEVNNLRR